MAVRIKRATVEERLTKYDLDVDCSSDADCSDVGNSACSPLTKKCVCKRGYFYDSTACIGGEIVSKGTSGDAKLSNKF